VNIITSTFAALIIVIPIAAMIMLIRENNKMKREKQ